MLFIYYDTGDFSIVNDDNILYNNMNDSLSRY